MYLDNSTNDCQSWDVLLAFCSLGVPLEGNLGSRQRRSQAILLKSLSIVGGTMSLIMRGTDSCCGV